MKQQQTLTFREGTVTKETSDFLQKGRVLKKHSTKSKVEVAENLREPVWCPVFPSLSCFCESYLHIFSFGLSVALYLFLDFRPDVT